ncbi:MAG: hypothetical protein WCN98_10530 [Verrucomicrobiaceae bacterium]
MTRTTTIIALVQTLVVILGFVAVGVVLKASGYPDNPMWVRWNPTAVFLRHYGGWLLFVPIIWTYCAGATLRDDHSRFSYSTMVALGIAFAVVTMIAFIYAAAFPFTQPLLIGI